MVSRFWKYMENKIYFPHNILRNAHQKWQINKKGKEINIFKSLARSNVFSTQSEEQEVNLVWPNLCIFWLPFICLYGSWSWSLPNFVWMNSSGYQNYRSSLLTEFRAEKIIYLGFVPSGGHWAKSFFSLNTNFVNSVATRSPNF
jgi:hypothetical protein